MKAVLVDDEQLALEYLEIQIKALETIEILGKFTFFDVKKRAKLIKEADVFFLDIEMPEVTGLELAEKLLQENSDLVIVFVTAFNEYAVQAFELNALDYILKPIEFDRLAKTIKRVEDTISSMPEQADTTNNHLKVNLCNNLSFQINNDDIQHIQWRTTKAKDLFLYLLYNQGYTSRKSELTDLFWGELEEERAFPQLYTAIYHIRKTIREFEGHFSLKSLHEGYILNTNDVLIDIVEWESQLKSLDKINEDTIEYWIKAMNFYTGELLPAYDMLWIQSERFRLEQLWVKSALQIASYYNDIKEVEKAEEWFLKICKLRPEEENAHFELMKIYDQLGLGLLVDHQYTVLNNIAKDLNIDINNNIKQWYLKHNK